MVLRVNPFSMFAGKLRKKRASIICPVCGAAMEIILTRISKPPTRQRSPASLLPDQAAIPPKKDVFYIISGLVQQTVQIVRLWFATLSQSNLIRSRI